jgi:excisionase family DNA binding protein
MALPTYVTVAEIAESARCTVAAVREAIKRGDLEATAPIGTRLLIREENALAWLERKPADTDEEELGATA